MFVSSSETGDQLLFRFVKPASEIVGHASVKSAGRISEYVNVVALFAAHEHNPKNVLSSRAKRGIRVSHAPFRFQGRQEPRSLALLGMTTPW
jgi:hypothetical protein